ncbi:MAG TPA: GAF domain-containing sensor histidine kinase [Terricaulis sp.]|nr:GAF domain-containing sensor histidine kinase [Terricaulis sp.]
MYGERLTGQAALDTLMEAVERLAGASDEKAVAAIVRTAARRLTGADGVSVVLRKEDRVHYIDEDAVSPLWKGQDFPIEACISGWAIMHRQTVVISDITGDPRIPLAAYRPTFVKSLVMAPVGMPDPYASIGAYWAAKRRPTDEEVHALETIARAASVAMQNARLRRELTEALARTEAAERAQAIFFAQMSRNIRVPLTGLATMAELLERGQSEPRQQQLAASLRTSADDVAHLVEGVLDFAQAEGARGARFPAPFHLEAAVRVAAAPHVTEASRRGLGFAIEIAPEAAEIFVGDGAHVQKLADLMVDYAVKNTENGAVTVRIAQRERVGVRSLFELSVDVAGACFAAAAARYAAGERAHAALDLAIAEAIARAMGGALDVTAAERQGGALSVRFPLDMPMDELTERRLAGRVFAAS